MVLFGMRSSQSNMKLRTRSASFLFPLATFVYYPDWVVRITVTDRRSKGSIIAARCELFPPPGSIPVGSTTTDSYGLWR